MTNTFQRIGNNLEKKREERKKSKDKYWKLSSVERIDYNMHINQIEDDYKIIPLQFTRMYFKLFLYITIFFGLFGFIFNVWDMMFESIRLIWKVLIRFLWIPIFIDLITMMMNENSLAKQENKLNKRFKLC